MIITRRLNYMKKLLLAALLSVFVIAPAFAEGEAAAPAAEKPAVAEKAPAKKAAKKAKKGKKGKKAAAAEGAEGAAK